MRILAYPLGQMQANCYMLLEDRDCIIIDPGDSADFILEEVSRRNLNVIAVIATHGHFDHIMAVGELVLSLGCPFYIHPEDWFLVERLESTAKHFLDYEPHVIKPQTYEPLKPGVLRIGEFSLQVMHTPGHTPGSCSLYIKKENMLFTGDTLFMGAIGRYDFAYSDKALLKQSVEQIIALPGETIIRAGHGEETFVEAEKRNIDYFF